MSGLIDPRPKSDVGHINGNHYFVKGPDGRKSICMSTIHTMKAEKAKPEARLEAGFDKNNHALSLLPTLGAQP